MRMKRESGDRNRTARIAEIIKDELADDEVGLNNTVRVYFEEDEEEDTYRIVTTVREDVLNGIISNISPMGKALLGHKVGDRVEVVPGKGDPFHIVIREIVKTTDESRDSYSIDDKKYGQDEEGDSQMTCLEAQSKIMAFIRRTSSRMTS